MKSIHIVIKDDKKGVVKIQLTQREVNDAFDFIYMIDDKDQFMKNLKLNKCEKSFYSIHKKIERVLDALHEGQCYDWDSQKKKLIKSKHKYYHSGRKPKWQKKKC